MPRKDIRVHIGDLGVFTAIGMQLDLASFPKTLRTKCGKRRGAEFIARGPGDVTCGACIESYRFGLSLGAPPVIWPDEIRAAGESRDILAVKGGKHHVRQ